MKQTTILTSHKGVDLHAASAVRVMRERLPGGGGLRALYRCEMHTFWRGEGLPEAPSAERLLGTGRYYNPNMHHFGHFTDETPEAPWLDRQHRGAALPAAWPGEVGGSDFDTAPPGLYDVLLGGAVPAGALAVDICGYPLGESGPVLSGVLWRLVLEDEGDGAKGLAESLAVTRDGGGLLVNPHMQGWLIKEHE